MTYYQSNQPYDDKGINPWLVTGGALATAGAAAAVIMRKGRGADKAVKGATNDPPKPPPSKPPKSPEEVERIRKNLFDPPNPKSEKPQTEKVKGPIRSDEELDEFFMGGEKSQAKPEPSPEEIKRQQQRQKEAEELKAQEDLKRRKNATHSSYKQYVKNPTDTDFHTLNNMDFSILDNHEMIDMLNNFHYGRSMKGTQQAENTDVLYNKVKKAMEDKFGHRIGDDLVGQDFNPQTRSVSGETNKKHLEYSSIGHTGKGSGNAEIETVARNPIYDKDGNLIQQGQVITKAKATSGKQYDNPIGPESPTKKETPKPGGAVQVKRGETVNLSELASGRTPRGPREHSDAIQLPEGYLDRPPRKSPKPKSAVPSSEEAALKELERQRMAKSDRVIFEEEALGLKVKENELNTAGGGTYYTNNVNQNTMKMFPEDPDYYHNMQFFKKNGSDYESIGSIRGVINENKRIDGKSYRESHLGNIDIDKAHRGNGYSHPMYQAYAKELNNKFGNDYVLSSTFVNPRARNAYEKNKSHFASGHDKFDGTLLKDDYHDKYL